jgi:hypothetical protein
MADTIDQIVGGGGTPVAGAPSNTPDPSSGHPDGNTPTGGDPQEQLRAIAKEKNEWRARFRDQESRTQQALTELAELRGMMQSHSPQTGNGQGSAGSLQGFSDSELSQALRENADNPESVALIVEERVRRQVQDQVKTARDDGFRDRKLDQHREKILGQISAELGEWTQDRSSPQYETALNHFSRMKQVHGDLVDRVPELERLAFLEAWKGTEFSRMQDELTVLRQKEQRRMEQEQMEQGLVGGASDLAARKEALEKGDTRAAIRNLGVMSTLRGG